MKPEDGLIGATATRAAPLTEGTLDSEARSFSLAVASETPVRRYHYDLGDFDEVLLCNASAVDLSRFAPDAAGPLLLDHDPARLVGVIDSMRIDPDRVVRASARAQRSPQGDQLLTDIGDRVRRGVSVGYRILDVQLQEKRGQRPRVVVTHWQPYEVSVVAFGADPAVGIGRSYTEPYPDAVVRRLRGVRNMTDDDPKAADGTPAKAEPKVDVRVIENEARKAELSRVREISAIAKRFALGDEGDKAIDAGTAVEAFRTLALERIEARQKAKAQTSSVVDLSKRDRERYSVGRVVQALLTGKREQAGLEAEVTDSYVKEGGVQLRNHSSFYVPLRFLRPSGADRSLTAAVREELLGIRAAVSVGGTGGNLVGTDHLADEYVPHLLSDLVVVRAGARILPGLTGNIDIPAGDGSYGTAQWLTTETSNAPEAAPALRQVPGIPHTVAAYTDFTRRMRLQSLPAIEAIVRTGLSDALNEAVERAALNGSGLAGQPRGVYQTVGVAAADFTTFVFRDWINMWGAVKQAKGTTARPSFITNNVIAAKAMSTTRGGTGSDIMIAAMAADGTIRIDGFPLYTTQESPQGFGSPPLLHGVAFGDWTKLLIAQWGEGVELNVDTSSLSLQGASRIIAFLDTDILVTLAQSFAVADNVSAA